MEERDLSRLVTLEVTLKNLEDDMKCTNAKIASLDKKLDELVERLSGWRGGLLAILGLASLAGISFASIVVFLRGL